MKNLNTKAIYNLSLRSLALLSFLLFFSAFTKDANESLSYTGNMASSMQLSGYSNLNNWTMGFKSMNSEGRFMLKDGELDEINALQFDIVPTMLASEGVEVDSALYTVLVNGKAQKISFKLTKQMILPIMKKVHLVGDFTFAGVTRPVSLYMDYVVDQNKNVRLSGTNTILLSNFTTTSTSAKLKTLKCYDQLTFSLQLNFQAKF